ncbi:MAG: UPF0175 family protein [Chromatiaceae bacterium]|nr:UPF0175 family protein [Chromatiaceae bacterium]MBP6733780.1 UPF0175 family protein [Chromatiaceae bacterium]MBP6808649.1 UPF0175 family protein [Chromatiaceae bacterium]MBP8288940.1 UPF0175 family protein [Chromatiaceae bacterium]
MNLAFDIDPSVLASVRRDPEEFLRELRLAAAVKWYELERVSQGRAAEIAGVSRAEFIDALGKYGVTPFQQTGEEIVADLEALKRVYGPEASGRPCLSGHLG